MKKYSFFIIALSLMAFWPVAAEVPTDYYKNCEGKSGKALLESLHSAVTSHTVVSYDGLWKVYKTSDVRPNGTVWDMYSTKEWSSDFKQCGSYQKVGDCINREHSFPKSWFSKASPMVSDAFHVYPTDGKVNNQRSNFPYGECSGGTTLPANGSVKPLGKLGTSTFAGYSGKVFEPADEYKGDFARTYFYMAACYNNRISNWDSEMLAGNSYPAFSSWALQMLLKWHRQDPVSDKERDRNEAVYKYQHNRNPFIDYPELVEYVWGNKTAQKWEPDGDVDPAFITPVDGTTVDIGVTGPGISRSRALQVRGVKITDNVNVSISGTGFSINTNQLAASAVMSGRATVVVSYCSSTVANGTGTLTLTTGSVTTKVTVTARAVSGLPATDATDICETSFMAHWSNVDGDGAMYMFTLYLNDETVSGYPVKVPAEDESYLVEDLEIGAHYSYTLSNGTVTSNRVYVTTATPIPSVSVYFDGNLEFTSRPGEPSDIAELLLEAENITGDITVSVEAPFEVSTDKSNWLQAVILDEREDRVYLRLNGDTEGTYTTELVITAGDYMNDDVDITGRIVSGTDFIETFEQEYNNSYTDGSFMGVTGRWNTNDAGVWEQDKKLVYEGAGACRFGKSAASYIATAEPKAGGIGTVSFMANPWSGDGSATVALQWSSDGANWATAATVQITGSGYVQYQAPINRPGNVYFKLQQTSGKRLLIDDVKLSDCSEVGAVEQLYYHSWDAFCRDGVLVIENKGADSRFNVYGIDGIERLDSPLPQGETLLRLPAGLYIVVSGDFSRRVLVK